MTDTYLGKNFKFHLNLNIPANKIKRNLIYYKQIFKRWSENLSSFPNLPSAIASQVICIPNNQRSQQNHIYDMKDIKYIGHHLGRIKEWI